MTLSRRTELRISIIASLGTLTALVTSSTLVLAQSARQAATLVGPLAELDIKDAEMAPSRARSQGTLTNAQLFALDPGWLNPIEHQLTGVHQDFDYFVQDTMFEPTPQGVRPTASSSTPR